MENIGKILGIIAIVALLTVSVPFIGRLAAAPDGEVLDKVLDGMYRLMSS